MWEKDIFPPPICTVPSWRKKSHFGKGGGKNMIFGKIYTPGLRGKIRSGRKI